MHDSQQNNLTNVVNPVNNGASRKKRRFHKSFGKRKSKTQNIPISGQIDMSVNQSTQNRTEQTGHDVNTFPSPVHTRWCSMEEIPVRQVNHVNSTPAHPSATFLVTSESRDSLGTMKDTSTDHKTDSNRISGELHPFRSQTQSLTDQDCGETQLQPNRLSTIPLSGSWSNGYKVRRNVSRKQMRNSMSDIGYGKLESYKKLELIGEGAYANVYRGYSKLLHRIVALKEIRMEETEGAPCTAIREISLLRNLRHANIVTLHDVIYTEKSLTLVFEYVGQDLRHYMEAHDNRLPSKTVQIFMFQIFRALEFCHARRILHRDLKPQNLLITETRELKLADFGLARAKSIPTKTYSNEVATLWYRPPDVLLGDRNYSGHIDIWGAGCIFYEMSTGQPLFPGESKDNQIVIIFQKCGIPPESYWPGLHQIDKFKQLVLNKVAYKPVRSKTSNSSTSASFPTSASGIEEYTNHLRTLLANQTQRLAPDGVDLLTDCLHLLGVRRISAASALEHAFFQNVLPKHVSLHDLSPEQTIFVNTGSISNRKSATMMYNKPSDFALQKLFAASLDDVRLRSKSMSQPSSEKWETENATETVQHNQSIIRDPSPLSQSNVPRTQLTLMPPAQMNGSFETDSENVHTNSGSTTGVGSRQRQRKVTFEMVGYEVSPESIYSPVSKFATSHLAVPMPNHLASRKVPINSSPRVIRVARMAEQNAPDSKSLHTAQSGCSPAEIIREREIPICRSRITQMKNASYREITSRSQLAEPANTTNPLRSPLVAIMRPNIEAVLQATPARPDLKTIPNVDLNHLRDPTGPLTPARMQSTESRWTALGSQTHPSYINTHGQLLKAMKHPAAGIRDSGRRSPLKVYPISLDDHEWNSTDYTASSALSPPDANRVEYSQDHCHPDESSDAGQMNGQNRAEYGIQNNFHLKTVMDSAEVVDEDESVNFREIQGALELLDGACR
ncbi:hypothetical protein P879_01190 [Paragonimus westermani]|uniref:cyclin-dependent kinase n=1 Tax=Paragonimus westermani TaxID=34504 RepID=A0A8T0DNR6_9TREM|nr:hypothetical protein P879_01190 [Paragonimus westermani]